MMITTLFDWFGRLAVAYPRRMLACYALVLLAAVPLVWRIQLEANVRDTLPPDMAQALERQNTLFGTADLAFLLVQGPAGARETLLAFGAAVAAHLRDASLIRHVEYGYAPELLPLLERLSFEYAPLFVTPEQLDAFDQLLTPQGLTAQLQKTVLQLQVSSPGLQDQWLLEDPLQLRRFAFARLSALRGTFRFDTTSPYFLSTDGTALLIKIAGQHSVHDMAAAKAMVALLQETTDVLLALPAFHSLRVEATGGYFFAAESERIIRGDIIMSVHLTIVSICVLIAWVLRRWGVLIYGILPTLLSLFLALGIFATMRPMLNALTLGCIASLIGFGMDFSLHVLQRAFAEQGRGLSRPAALRLAVRETGGGLALAALTTMASFLAFYASSQPFLRDMGLLAAIGMGLSCVLSATFLPAMLVLLPLGPARPPFQLGLPTIIAAVTRFPRLILGVSVLLSGAAVAALLCWPPAFETDLRNIHASNSPTLRVQERIATLFGGSQEPLIFLIEADTEQQAVQHLHTLQPTLTAAMQDGLLAAVTSPSLLYPAPTAQEAVFQRLRAKDPQQLRRTLLTSLEEAGFATDTAQAYADRLQQLFTHQTPVDLPAFRALGFEALLQPLLAHDAHGAVGLALLFPTHDLWTQTIREALTQRLTAALTAHGIRGTLNGLYTVSSTSAALLSADFLRITVVAFLGVALIVCLKVRRMWLSGMMLLPVACGTLWAAGFFALYGFQLNFMNIGIVPMLLATGSDYGIYIVHRFALHGRADTRDALQISGLGVLLSAFTTLEGFGTLAFSVNRGIASVGLVSLVGICACLGAALFTLPAVLHLWREKESPA